MNIIKIYKYQLFLYVFIVLFTIQNALFLRFNASFKFYKEIVEFVFIISVVTVFISVIILIVQAVKSINRNKVNWREITYLLVNLVLYYLVVLSSLILSTQFPHSPNSI